MSSIPGDGSAPDSKRRTGSGCPGACSVSTKCYLPNVLVEEWILPRLRRASNLVLFLRTAVVGTVMGRWHTAMGRHTARLGTMTLGALRSRWHWRGSSAWGV